MRTITKIFYRGLAEDDPVTIRFTERGNLYSATCREVPSASFLRALSDLAPAVCDLCEFPDFAIRVIGARFACHETDLGVIRSVSITATRELSRTDAPLVIKTPRVSDRDFPDPSLLDALQDEALHYVDGHRATRNLWDAETTPGKGEGDMAE